MAALMLIVIVMMMVVMLMLLFLSIILKVLHNVFDIRWMLDCIQDNCSWDIIPWSCYDTCLSIMLLDHINSCNKLILCSWLSTAKNYSSTSLDLIQEELTKVLYVHLSFSNINNCCCTVKLYIYLLCSLLNSLNNIRELSNSWWLDDNSVRCVVFNNLLKCFTKITNKRTADTSGVHLIYLYSCILKESSIDSYLTELVLDKYEFLALKSFLNKLLDKSRLSGSKKSWYDINLSHFSFLHSSFKALSMQCKQITRERR